MLLIKKECTRGAVVSGKALVFKETEFNRYFLGCNNFEFAKDVNSFDLNIGQNMSYF